MSVIAALATDTTRKNAPGKKVCPRVELFSSAKFGFKIAS